MSYDPQNTPAPEAHTIALLYTPEAESLEHAMEEAEALAEGIGQDGENISVLGPIDERNGAYVGGLSNLNTLAALREAARAILPRAEVSIDLTGNVVITTGKRLNDDGVSIYDHVPYNAEEDVF